jgi:hypothetical protein
MINVALMITGAEWGVYATLVWDQEAVQNNDPRLLKAVSSRRYDNRDFFSPLDHFKRK